MEIISITAVIVLMFFHWLGDFVFQSRFMAENKSRMIDVLALHCVVYSLTMGVGVFITTWVVGFLFGFYVPYITLLSFAIFLGFIFLAHFMTDAVTSQLTSRYYSTGKTKKFWATIGFDQWLHIIQILLIF